jgi:hypothetical protein
MIRYASNRLKRFPDLAAVTTSAEETQPEAATWS